MKVKKKAREQTAMEKRNTDIVNFVLVALIPVLLCLLLGFSLEKSNTQNDANLSEQLKTLKEEKTLLEEKMEQLQNTFFSLDTIFGRFNSSDVKTLQRNLGTANDPFAFNDWDIDKNLRVGRVKSQFQKVEDAADFGTNEQFTSVLNYGVDWLLDYADTKDKELFAMKQLKQRDNGAEMNDLLKEQNEELDRQLIAKDNDIALLRLQLQQCLGSTQKGLESAAQDNTDILQELVLIKSQNKDINEKIGTELRAIKESLTNLQTKGLLANKKELEKNKADLEINLDAIGDLIGQLKKE